MQGSLALARGVLFVGHHAHRAHVRTFDLDGRRLEAGFSFAGPDGSRASAAGLAVDEDHRVWVADALGRRLLAFTLFGREVARVEASAGVAGTARDDRQGRLGPPSDVLSCGAEDEHRLLVASRGRRRHGVQILDLARGTSRSLRPLGEPAERFADVDDLALDGRDLFVCERRAGRIQVFRDGEFHYAIRLDPRGCRFEPTAAAPLPGGRLVVCQAGERSALLLLERGGRRVRTLATTGEETGAVCEPADVVVEPGADERTTRIAVIDRDGDRVQVFNCEGRCFGSFPDFLEARVR